LAHNYNQNFEVDLDILASKISSIIGKYLDKEETETITKLIIRAERMGVSTHGLHYFVHSIYPLLLNEKSDFSTEIKENIIISEGNGSIGISNLYKCLSLASDNSEKTGISLILIKNPGKVGALRVYGVDLVKNGKLMILMKNTASTQGHSFTKKHLIGTNPICFAFPESNFIFDTSTSTVATNSVRLMNKQEKKFPFNVGFDEHGENTNDPKELLKDKALLSTFSEGPFWYKSFFLGLAIESLAALAGGKTGPRVGEKKGRRLNSQEGLFGIVIDKSIFPYYQTYKAEIEILFKEIKACGVHIPGDFDDRKTSVMVSQRDWDFINKL
jgi:L-2-hydroxycarboxylate dehydrogenase (NAD+)